MLHQILATPDGFQTLKSLTLAPGEGVMLAKFVLLTQPTLQSGNAASKVESAPSVLLIGNLDEMKAQLSAWLEEAIGAYQK
jgi:hypothetical protein